MQHYLIGSIIISIFIFGTVQLRHLYNYLGLNKIEALSIAILTSSFIVMSLGKLIVMITDIQL
ncbi:hypothetical protein [Flammeovirga kamogawensis]|uniref:Uncharacterized protein n=1 Tax=Flammeovirga kamogawensis TaxID=373891 RepID=A0ABX8GVG5_9BACT|nr:hypothetical protein [Flammeovirga kamogawensis]MBB6459630.1 hypothetical protein [Flammeovirga kamogawensis]QWG07307.1 hypothetical protein KM029_18685 [Flammeovirga kamogawensis]TRX69124.1 hypothetical protein EO216_13685 [Flammeovirga kamogawensis]